MSEKKVVLSIIIPVYNVEAHLEQCIRSILQSEIHDLEIFLIDDQSTDASGQLCDFFAQQYDHCYSYHNEKNKGLGATRNIGLNKARGEYITFIDADDYINSEQLNNIVSILMTNNKTDLFLMNAHKVYNNGIKEPIDQPYESEKLFNQTREEVFSYLALQKKYPGSACTKIIRREIILENAIFFQEGVLSEDLEWVVRALLFSKTFNSVEGEYYYYRQQRHGSITSSVSEKRLWGIINAIERSVKDVENEDAIVRRTIKGFMAYEYLIALWMYDQIKNNLTRDRESIYKNFFLKNIKLLNYKRDKKYQIIKYILELTGVDFTARILTIIKRGIINVKKK